jgi:hypothetical protein
MRLIFSADDRFFRHYDLRQQKALITKVEICRHFQWFSIIPPAPSLPLARLLAVFAPDSVMIDRVDYYKLLLSLQFTNKGSEIRVLTRIR